MRQLKQIGFIAAAMSLLLFIACGGGDKKKDVDVDVVPVPVITPGTPGAITMGGQQSFLIDTADFTLSAPENAGCKQSGNNVTCEPKAAGEYVITIAAKADATKTKTVTLTVNELVLTISPEGETQTTAVTQPVTFEANTAVTLSESTPAAAGCVNINSTTVTCTPTAKGEYPVTVIATADTSKTKTVTLSVDAEEIAGMVFVEHGTFTMGCTSDSDCVATDNDLKPHEVTLTKDFYIGKYEVTRAQWKDVVTRTADSGHGLDADPSAVKEYPVGTENDSLPVTNVSWDDVQKFIVALNSLPENATAGRTYRLPTEAEWEYAARGGNQSQNHTYVGGSYNYAWYMDNSDGTPHPVGTKNSNELDVYDMSGNVSEWCNDLYNDYDTAPQIDPPGPVTDSLTGEAVARIRRSGSFNSGMHSLFVWARGFMGATWGNFDLGFRLVLEVPTYETPVAEPTFFESASETVSGVWDSAISGIKSLWNSIAK